MTSKVVMQADWFLKIDVDELIGWISKTGIADKDWLVAGGVGDPIPIILFNNETDALAFKLKFCNYVLHG